jgi:hypothetical protein
MDTASESILAQRAEAVARDCVQTARRLARRAELARRRRILLRSVNVVVGATAVTAAFVPAASELVRPGGVKLISLIAAFVLILDGVLPIIVGDDTYERLSEYAMYIHSYAGTLLNTLADEGLTIQVRRARVTEVLQMAVRNLDDVRSK